jgi:EmrB/QacA subfamily drug resistance transporter
MSAELSPTPLRHPAGRTPHTITFAVLAVGALAYGLLQSMVAPALPVLRHDLHASETGVAWILTAFLLSGSIATPVIGRLGDIYGKKRTLVAMLATLAVGTLMSAVATSLPLMIAGRVVQGVAGGLFPLAFGIIRDEFPRERVAAGLGLISATLGIGAGAGTVLAGVIIQHLNYHWLFWLPLVAVAMAAVVAALLIPESRVRAPARIPWSAALLFSGGLAGVLVGVSQASAWGWGSGRTVGLIVVGLGLLAVWVLVELRLRQPLVDMRVMARRGVWTTNLAAFLIGIAVYSSFILIPQLVTLPKSTGFGFGASITGAGLFMLPMTLMVLVSGTLAGRLERSIGSKRSLLAGAISGVAGFALLALAHSHRSEIYLAGALIGVGPGLGFAAMANLIVNAVRQDQVGVATGISTISRTVGGALGTEVVATLLTSNLAASNHLPDAHGFVLSFWILAATLAVAVLVTLAIPRRAVARKAAAAPTEQLREAA